MKFEPRLCHGGFDALFEIMQVNSDFKTPPFQPMRHDAGAGAQQVIHENDPGAAHGNGAIGDTEKLPALRRNRTFKMRSREFFRRSHIKKIGRSRLVPQPRFGRRTVDEQQIVVTGECFEPRLRNVFGIVTGGRICL